MPETHDEITMILHRIANRNDGGTARISYDAQSERQFCIYSEKADYGSGNTLRDAIRRAHDCIDKIESGSD